MSHEAEVYVLRELWHEAEAEIRAMRAEIDRLRALLDAK